MKRWLYLMVFLAAFVNCSALFVTIIGPDGALYASISKTMAQTNNYTDLFVEGKDWLDKPHFPFWITAFSFELFGYTTWAYKLPAIIFVFIGAYYSYLLSKKLYNEEVGLWSVLFLLTAEHIIISNNDVRAEPYLTGLVIPAVYHFYRSYTEKKLLQTVFASFFTACAMMTKGPFVLITIGGAIGLDLLIRKEWKQIFHVRWILAAAMILIFLIPEMYSLWSQFDAHPEKIVFGTTNVSGIRFFFWDSQFGRFFNTGPIKGKGDMSFFLHTTLWAFLPWSILFFAALFLLVKSGLQREKGLTQKSVQPSVLSLESSSNVQRKTYNVPLLLGAIIPSFIIFSLSKFQLPHYLNYLFPFFAILLAVYITSEKRTAIWINWVQYSICALLVMLCAALHMFYRPGNTWLIMLLFIILAISILMIRKADMHHRAKALLASAVTIIVINCYLNWNFYPSLLKYQSGSEAAFYLNENNPGLPVYTSGLHAPYALDFYLNAKRIMFDPATGHQLPPTTFLFFITQDQRKELQQKHIPIRVVKSFDHFHVSQVSLKFLNPSTRQHALKQYELVLIQ